MIRGTVIAILISATTAYGQSEVSISTTKDNTLYESTEGTLSNGAGEHMFAGNTMTGSTRRAVLAFDIAGNVPAGSTIDSVKLTLYFSRTSGDPQDVELRKVLADWGEGTSDANGDEGGGAPATTGDATWVHTFYNTDFWTSSGGDYSGTVSASQTIGDFFQYGYYTWGSTPEMVADVQDWLDNPSESSGWLLLCNEIDDGTSKRFDTKENAAEENRPVLTVYYSSNPICEILATNPRQASILCKLNGDLAFRLGIPNSTTSGGTTLNFRVNGGTAHQAVVGEVIKGGNVVANRIDIILPGDFLGQTNTITIDECPDISWVKTCPAPDAMDLGGDEDLLGVPERTELLGNYPNPFNPSTTISYALSAETNVTLRVYNTLGQEVATLVNQKQEAGYREARWDASGVSSGIYLYRLMAGDVVQTGRMNLIK